MILCDAFEKERREKKTQKRVESLISYFFLSCIFFFPIQRCLLRLFHLILFFFYKKKYFSYDEQPTISFVVCCCCVCARLNSSRKDYHAVVQLLLENDPTQQTVFFPDKSMALPLHTACRYQASAAVIELLLQYQPLKQLLSPGPYHQLPLHIACRCQHADAVPVLLKYDTEQALVPDHTGRLPIHLAYLKQMDADVTIRSLLEAMLLGRSEQRGLVLWKQDLQTMIRCLELEERDFMTSCKLEVTRNVLVAFFEQSVCLELVLWHRMLIIVGSASEQQQDREAGRIKSGAHVILPHVLSFLEGDPIDEIVEQIQK